MRRRIVSFASLFLSAALLISSCCGCAKKKENDSDLDEEIVEVIKNYGKAVKKLSIDKILDYASDSDFDSSPEKNNFVKDENNKNKIQKAFNENIGISR